MEKKKKKQKKPLSYRAKYRWYKFASIMAYVIPILAIVLYNSKVYFSVENKPKLYIGLMAGLVIIIIVVVGKLKLQRIMWFSILFGAGILFESLIRDFQLITGALLFGAVVDTVFFKWRVKKFERLANAYEEEEAISTVKKETNKELANDMAEAIIEVMRSGRV